MKWKAGCFLWMKLLEGGISLLYRQSAHLHVSLALSSHQPGSEFSGASTTNGYALCVCGPLPLRSPFQTPNPWHSTQHMGKAKKC